MLYEPRISTKETKKYVILVHGSGAQDRYSPYYISLAYALSNKGFGVLLYDKRGAGESSGNFETASIEDLAGDAVAAYHYLKTSEDLKKIEIGFLGTSQGGWIASLASNKVGDCDFLILNVGPAVSVFEQDLHRIEYTMKADGWNQSDIDSALAYSESYFQFVKDKSNSTWVKLQELGAKAKNERWAEFIHIPKHKNDFEWWRNNNYDPKETLENLHCRTLSLFGELDPLVPPVENVNLMTEYLTKSGIEFDIKIIPEVVHDMKTFHGLNGDNWNWPSVYWTWRTEPEAYLASIVAFLEGE
jgi:pimeloyl-ACP methyl ester carboxylesterase